MTGAPPTLVPCRILEAATRLCAPSNARPTPQVSLIARWITTWVLHAKGWRSRQIARALPIDVQAVIAGILRVRQTPELFAMATGLARALPDVTDLPLPNIPDPARLRDRAPSSASGLLAAPESRTHTRGLALEAT